MTALPEQWTQLVDLEPSVAEFRSAVIEGLSRPQKSIPCKFFYDAAGSRLFEAICALPEYYPTRTERQLLCDMVPEAAALAGPGRAIVEFGSGAGVKIRTLLDTLEPIAYVPVDISRTALIEAAGTLAADYPSLRILPVCADYTKPFALPPVERPAWLGFFPGSTIGNFSPPQAARFLAQARRMLGASGLMLVGVDLKKDPAILDAAYDDAEGVTAAFNLNLLTRINRELGADFELDRFAHRAHYDQVLGRVEMHLVSLGAQSVRVGQERFTFRDGETIHTENSYKYDPAQFARLAESAGWRSEGWWTDRDQLFSLHLLGSL